MVIFVYYLCKKFYRDKLVNVCESIFFVVLIVIVIFSLVEVMLVFEGVEVSGFVEIVFWVFEWVELILFVVVFVCLCVFIFLVVLL